MLSLSDNYQADVIEASNSSPNYLYDLLNIEKVIDYDQVIP